MNAEIEAARAGSAGRGFAVVVFEVRKLAVLSNKATANMTRMINATCDKVNAEMADAHASLVEYESCTKGWNQRFVSWTEMVMSLPP
jgi:methyl-accepting chemotaxis protein